jgi:uracil-DNA glycosylase
METQYSLVLHFYGDRTDGIISQFQYQKALLHASKYFSISPNRKIFVEKVRHVKGTHICIFKSYNSLVNKVQFPTPEKWELVSHSSFLDKTLVIEKMKGKYPNNSPTFRLDEKSLFVPISERQETYENSSLAEYTYKYIPPGWGEFFCKIKMRNIVEDLSINIKKKCKNKLVFPPLNLVYNAFELCSPEGIKVVIIGQDPYPNQPGDAMGLAFSVPDNIKVPRSLQNIYKELENDGYRRGLTGNLTKWAQRGVFLINTALTVEHQNPNSHSSWWEDFTTQLVIWLNDNFSHIVWALWGSKASSFNGYIDKTKHSVVENVHPVSYNGKWFNSKPFAATDLKLKKYGNKVDWNLN